MRLHEILSESATSGASSAGAIATVSMPLGSGKVLKRSVYDESDKKKDGEKDQQERWF